MNGNEIKPNPTNSKPPVVTVQTGSIVGSFWFIGWLFTIGFAKLIWWQAIISVIVWPYFLGVALR